MKQKYSPNEYHGDPEKFIVDENNKISLKNPEFFMKRLEIQMGGLSEALTTRNNDGSDNFHIQKIIAATKRMLDDLNNSLTDEELRKKSYTEK